MEDQKTACMNMDSDWTGRNSREIFDMTGNREEWRAEVQKAVRAAN